jgi:hypothetical protein
MVGVFFDRSPRFLEQKGTAAPGLMLIVKLLLVKKSKMRGIQQFFVPVPEEIRRPTYLK